MHLGLLEAAAGGLLQGVAIIFPISGYGHGVLIGEFGDGAGSALAPADAHYLYACLRVSVGAALVIYFWRDWLQVGRGLLGTFARQFATSAQRRWAWLVVLAAVPSSVAIALVASDARPLATHPLLAAGALAANGLFMVVVWAWFRRSLRSGGLSGTHRARLTPREDAITFAEEAATMRVHRLALIGWLPVAALVPGLSGVGMAICAGLLAGLTQEQAARLALFVLAPPLLTWGASEFPDLSAAEFDGIRPAVALACAVAVVAAWFATWLSMRYFQRASLRPFAYYCVLAGAGATAWLTLS